MAAPISDAEMMSSAEEHLVYEARMLAHAAFRLADRRDLPRDPESNVLLESFAVHVRCLDGFLWGTRNPRYKRDTFAADFCEPGVWERERGDRPPVLVELADRRRLGHEVVHLSYDRSDVAPEVKDWPVGEILTEIVYGIDQFVVTSPRTPQQKDPSRAR